MILPSSPCDCQRFLRGKTQIYRGHKASRELNELTAKVCCLYTDPYILPGWGSRLRTFHLLWRQSTATSMLKWASESLCLPPLLEASQRSLRKTALVSQLPSSSMGVKHSEAEPPNFGNPTWGANAHIRLPGKNSWFMDEFIHTR